MKTPNKSNRNSDINKLSKSSNFLNWKLLSVAITFAVSFILTRWTDKEPRFYDFSKTSGCGFKGFKDMDNEYINLKVNMILMSQSLKKTEEHNVFDKDILLESPEIKNIIYTELVNKLWGKSTKK